MPCFPLTNRLHERISLFLALNSPLIVPHAKRIPQTLDDERSKAGLSNVRSWFHMVPWGWENCSSLRVNNCRNPLSFRVHSKGDESSFLCRSSVDFILICWH